MRGVVDVVHRKTTHNLSESYFDRVLRKLLFFYAKFIVFYGATNSFGLELFSVEFLKALIQ